MKVEFKNYAGTILEDSPVIKQHFYQGDKINIIRNSFNFKKVVDLSSSLSNNQASAIYGDYLYVARYANNNANLLVFNKDTGVYITSINLNTNVHCNVLNFGVEFYQGNDIPVLYASEWDGNKSYFVFNIVHSGSSWSATLVQTINTSSLTSTAFGAGNSDMCIDLDGYLYSITYKLNSYLSVVSGSKNRYAICKFELPKLSKGSTVTLTDNDILDSFDIECFAARQDACYLGGKIFILAGLPQDSTVASLDPHTHLLVVDTFKKCLTNNIIIDDLNENKEPEGIYVNDGYLDVTFANDAKIFRFDF